MKIKIWDPDNEDEENAEEVEVDLNLVSGALADYRVQSAVEEYAERWHNESAGECGEAFEIHARVESKLMKFSISVDYSPSFYAAMKPTEIDLNCCLGCGKRVIPGTTCTRCSIVT